MNLDALTDIEFTGDIIRPGDLAYQQAARTYVAQGSPALIVRPRTAEGVAAAIRCARDNSAVLSVRSGGHHFNGYGTNVGGLVIDLSALATIETEPAGNVVRIGPGAVWGDVARTLQKYGLAISSGDTGSAGVGGLTLGGGIGWMVRDRGLTIDSLRAAQVVTADGTELRVSESTHGDLFWAIRGGGGNFGVVTSFEFVAAPVGRVVAGEIDYAGADAENVLRGWREHMRNAPDELNSTVRLWPPMDDEPAIARVQVCYAGMNEIAANAAIEPLRHFGNVLTDTVEQMEYADVLGMADPLDEARMVVRSQFVPEFTDDLLAATVGACCRPDGPTLQVRSLGGAVRRVASDATAFAHRDSEVLMISFMDVPPDASPAMISAALQLWQPLSAFGAGGYANFFTDLTAEDVRRIYPPAIYERLAVIKQKYDPHNVFRRNVNIAPGARPSSGRA